MNRTEILSMPVVQKYLHYVVGEENFEVAMNPVDGEMIDERIAEKIDMEVNSVRQTLIALSEEDLATYRRVRDNESGWLTYYWRYRYDRIPERLVEYMSKLQTFLEERRQYEKQNQFFLCRSCGNRYEFEAATELEFKCPNCIGRLESANPDIVIRCINNRIDEIEKQLSKV
jgi:transcription initiation factor TFIIE subunit alpha